MAIKGNRMIPNAHFHKNWEKYVKTWFNQPARKLKRRQARRKKARTIAPRPIAGLLRPVVRCPTLKYHLKERLGRGFTKTELKAAGINHKFAKTIGICVDYRRRNKSVESVQQNSQRLKEYKSKLIIFPKTKKKISPGESTLEECKMAVQFKGKLLPIVPKKPTVQVRVPTEDEKKFDAFWTLRRNKVDANMVGIRAKRLKMAQENPDDITKGKPDEGDKKKAKKEKKAK